MDTLKDRAPANRRNMTKNWEPMETTQEREIARVDSQRGLLYLRVPLVDGAGNAKWGGAYVQRIDVATQPRVQNIGIENLAGMSAFNASVVLVNPQNKQPYYADEAHAKEFVLFHGVVDGWARNLVGYHFDNFISVQGFSRRISVLSSTYLRPVSIITGARRYPFYLTDATQVLVKDCRAEHARHAFVLGTRTIGPNAFVRCTSTQEYVYSEPHQRFSVGGLYDGVRGGIAVQNREFYGTGHGWSGGNFVVWNAIGEVIVTSPPTGEMNLAIGVVGRKGNAFFPLALGNASDSIWESLGRHVSPISLYDAQLADRRRE